MVLDIDMTRRNKSPRPLSDDERARLEEFIDSIHYSARYDYSLRSFLASSVWNVAANLAN